MLMSARKPPFCVGHMTLSLRTHYTASWSSGLVKNWQSSGCFAAVGWKGKDGSIRVNASERQADCFCSELTLHKQAKSEAATLAGWEQASRLNLEKKRVFTITTSR